MERPEPLVDIFPLYISVFINPLEIALVSFKYAFTNEINGEEIALPGAANIEAKVLVLLVDADLPKSRMLEKDNVFNTCSKRLDMAEFSWFAVSNKADKFKEAYNTSPTLTPTTSKSPNKLSNNSPNLICK